MSAVDASNEMVPQVQAMKLGLPPLASDSESNRTTISSVSPITPGSKSGFGLTIHVSNPLGPSPSAPATLATNTGNHVEVQPYVLFGHTAPVMEAIAAPVPPQDTRTNGGNTYVMFGTNQAIPVQESLIQQAPAVTPYAVFGQPAPRQAAQPYSVFDGSQLKQAIKEPIQIEQVQPVQPIMPALPKGAPPPDEAIIVQQVTQTEAKEMMTNLSSTVTQDLPVLPLRTFSRREFPTIPGIELPAIDTSTISSMSDTEGWMGKLLGKLHERAYTSSRDTVNRASGNYDLDQQETRVKTHAMIRLKLKAMDPKCAPSRSMSRTSSFASGDDLSMSRVCSMDSLDSLDERPPTHNDTLELPLPGQSVGYKTEEHHHLSSLALDKILTEGSPSSSSAASQVTGDTTSINSTEEPWSMGEKPTLHEDAVMTLEAAKGAIRLAKATEDCDERVRFLV
jgi:hypothetical protein